MAAKVRLKSPGMAALLKSGSVRAELTTRAERVLSAAEANAPVASGEYRNNLRIVQDTTDRAVVRVVAGVSYGHIVEANTGTLSRALDSAGGS